MNYIGRSGDWAAYQRSGKTVFVNVYTLDTTDPIDSSLVASGLAFSQQDEIVEIENSARESFIGTSVFSASFGEDEMIKIPADVKAAAKRAIEWRRIYNRGGTDVGMNTARMLAKHDRISIRKIRHIAKYFPRHEVDNKAEGWKSGEKGFPSAGRVAWDLWGGDAGRRWASGHVARADKRSLVASALFAVDVQDAELDDNGSFSDGFDPTIPHVYFPSRQLPFVCMYCTNSPDNPVHDEGAVDYSLQDINPDSAHFFTETPGEPTVCAVCEKDENSWQHQHANYAYQLLNPQENQSHYNLVEEVAVPRAVSASAYRVSGDRILAHQASTSSAISSGVDYYVSVSADDQMVATGLFKEAGDAWYEWSPLAAAWLKSNPEGPVYLVDVDEDTAKFVVDSLSMHEGSADLREVDRDEYDLHEQHIQFVDWNFIDGLLAPSQFFSTFADVGTDGYTPEERAKNAAAQVRDKNGRFAKTSSKVYAPDGTTGTITKINKDNKTVTVQDDNGKETDYLAKDVVIRNPQPVSTVDLDKIRAIPRAVRPDQKAGGIGMLQPMGRDQISQVIADYAKFIESERASTASNFGTITDKAGVKVYDRIDDLDVSPIYMAIVDDVDHAAILDMIAIIPASSTGSEVETVRLTDLGWEIDPEIKADLLSSVPPAVSVLAGDQIESVKQQIISWYAEQGDSSAPEQAMSAEMYDEFGALTAAGGADRNRGNAEELRRYWLYGKGAAKIRWNTPGDWTRCYKHLVKYMGPRAKGYCALRHKEATGTWTGSRLNVGHKNKSNFNSSEVASSVDNFELCDACVEQMMNDPELVADMESDEATIVAAGGADRNRGNAEKLRRYWTVGKGGLKIRWNTPGDWTRCNRYLKKYMGPRAKGYCSLRHKEMTGTWPGSRNNIGNRKRKFSTRDSMFFTPGDLFDLTPEEEVLSIIACGANMHDEYIPEIPQEVEIEGGGMPFRIPTVAPVNIESGDGRLIRPMALTYRDLPIPLMWQIKTGTGHDGAVVVGRIDSIEMLPNGSLGNARGMFDTNPYAREAQRMVKEGFLRGVSVDLDRFQAISKADESLKEASENENIIGNDKTEISQGRVMGVTIVPKPAFQECSIEIDYDAMSGEVPEVVDGTYAGVPSDDKDAEAIVAAALIAAGIPVAPPSSWFNNPNLDKPTPLTVENDGRVFGHIATWTTDHIGLPFATKPPRSRSSYAYFHTGSLHTEDGDLVPVGQITLTGGHAPLDASAASAAAHYDNTRSAWCDVHAGEDEFGIWVAGALRPSVSPEQIRAVRASAPSGDWRPVNGRLEMVAVCSVNVPGFPVTRAFVASGSLLSLVAAGTATLLEQYKTADNSVLDELALRVARLEGPQRDKLEALRMASLDRRATEVRTKFEELASSSVAEFRDYNEETRAKYAKEGIAMPDGSYPIENEADLRNAIQAYGRAKDKEAAKKHIISRARALKATDSLPGKWQEAALIASAEDIQAKFESMGVKTLAQRYAEANAKFETFAMKPGEFDPKAHPRDDNGKFRAVLARLQSDVEEARAAAGDKQTDSKVADIKKIDDHLVGGDLNAAKVAGQKLILALDRTDTEIGDARLAERLRDDYAILGDVVYNIGVPLGEDKSLRYSELPEELKNFIDQLIKKVDNLSADDEEAKAVEFLNKYMAGDRQLTQAEISASLSKLVRILI